jgi:hypothetical protein
MRICGPVLVTFQLIFPHTAVSVIPFFHFSHSNIVIPWVAILIFVVSERSAREFVEGFLVSFIWVNLGMPDLGLFALIPLVLTSHRCLESVGWDRRTGQLKVYDDEAREWTLYEPYLSTEVDTGTDDTSTDDVDIEYENYNVEESSTGSNEWRRRGNDDERALLINNEAVWRNNEVRSRRGPQGSE